MNNFNQVQAPPSVSWGMDMQFSPEHIFYARSYIVPDNIEDEPPLSDNQLTAARDIVDCSHTISAFRDLADKAHEDNPRPLWRAVARDMDRLAFGLALPGVIALSSIALFSKTKHRGTLSNISFAWLLMIIVRGAPHHYEVDENLYRHRQLIYESQKSNTVDALSKSLRPCRGWGGFGYTSLTELVETKANLDAVCGVKHNEPDWRRDFDRISKSKSVQYVRSIVQSAHRSIPEDFV